MSTHKRAKDDYCPHITMKPVNLMATAGQRQLEEREMCASRAHVVTAHRARSGRIRRPPEQTGDRFGAVQCGGTLTFLTNSDIVHAILERVGFQERFRIENLT